MLTLHSPNANNIASIYSGAFYRFLDYELVSRTHLTYSSSYLVDHIACSQWRRWRWRVARTEALDEQGDFDNIICREDYTSPDEALGS